MTLSTKHYVGAAVVLVAVAGGSFFGGMQYAKAQRGRGTATFTMRGANGGNMQFAGGQAGQGRGGSAGSRAMGFGGAVVGEIIAADDKSITVKGADGGSKIVFFGGEVRVSKSSEGSAADLKAGEQVMVMGTANSDGSVTAQSIRLGDQPFMVRATTGESGAQGGMPAEKPAR